MEQKTANLDSEVHQWFPKIILESVRVCSCASPSQLMKMHNNPHNKDRLALQVRLSSTWWKHRKTAPQTFSRGALGASPMQAWTVEYSCGNKPGDAPHAAGNKGSTWGGASKRGNCKAPPISVSHQSNASSWRWLQHFRAEPALWRGG